MTVSLRHPHTGEIRVLQEGWSWGCFLGSGILGLPLFRRGLQVWGAAMVVFNAVALILWLVPTHRAATLDGWMSLAGFGLCGFFGLKANRKANDRLLAHGREYADRWRKLIEA